jgi:hypothetical protein
MISSNLSTLVIKVWDPFLEKISNKPIFSVISVVILMNLKIKSKLVEKTNNKNTRCMAFYSG